MQTTDDSSVLNSIYRGALTGSRAIRDILPQVKNTGLRSDLTTQESEYAAICADAAKRLHILGGCPEDVPALKRAGMKLGVTMNTALNRATPHLAEVMIQGSTMGITNMTRVLHTFSAAGADAAGLANRLITAEQQNIDRLKIYL